MTLEMDAMIVSLLKELIPCLASNPDDRTKPVMDKKAKLAETLILAVFPGPTADVNIVSSPEGVSGATIDFNWMR